ncbi:hypothetical protein SMB34_10980 [Thalassospira permensis NBRC 106175]|uniref:Uncharacterized protein n=1 Tax=Thalassospira permensis NBRC 106175 TaxID=1353532 RepID=A0ABR4TVC3_9PROT|nr:hypothetical protein SMB34_10980 [Thalassospira permensis NBRC 106175]
MQRVQTDVQAYLHVYMGLGPRLSPCLVACYDKMIRDEREEAF